jgi:hypothetical protein
MSTFEYSTYSADFLPIFEFAATNSLVDGSSRIDPFAGFPGAPASPVHAPAAPKQAAPSISIAPKPEKSLTAKPASSDRKRRIGSDSPQPDAISSSSQDDEMGELSESGGGGEQEPAPTLQQLLDEQELKRRRLARKAELARLSRSSKKMRMQELENEVQRLKNQLASVSAAAAAAVPCSSTAIPAVSLATALGSAEPYSAVKFLETYIKERANSVLSILDSVAVGSQDCLVVRFVYCLFTQADSFYEDCSSLWNKVFSSVDSTPEQLVQLLALRSPAPSVSKITSLAQFESQFRAKITGGVDKFSQVCKILDAEQLGRFVQWIITYGEVCLSVLSH